MKATNRGLVNMACQRKRMLTDDILVQASWQPTLPEYFVDPAKKLLANYVCVVILMISACRKYLKPFTPNQGEHIQKLCNMQASIIRECFMDKSSEGEDM